MFRVTGGINCALYQNLHQMKITINIRKNVEKRNVICYDNTSKKFLFPNNNIDKC